ncbi:MAG: hypothetical protein FWG02_05705 [Holophagaceae bacterium]|nr:hypothetical protein [Holophagaceae bacterium]
MADYYSKSTTRGSSSTVKGTPQQAIDYLTDDHDSKRIASASKEEIDYIARINPGYKTDLEGGRVPLEGHGRCSGHGEAEMRRIFLDSCIPKHRDSWGRKTTATEGYKSHTLTLPKELSLLAESNPQAAYRAMNKAISEALEKTYPGKDYAAVSAIHRRNNEAEIHFHAHVLVGKFAKDKATGKEHSLNSPKQMAGLLFDGKRIKPAWTEAVTKELAKEFQVQIRNERAGQISLAMPDGRVLEPINRASRREIEKAIAPQIPYIDKHGTEKTKAFALTSMDAKIMEIASRNKGRSGWDREAFLSSFPKDSARIGRFEKRVETLKSIGYLSPSGRVTDKFHEHAKVKWGDSPQLHQLRTELERERQKPNSPGIPKILESDRHKQGRIQRLGLSSDDMVSAQRKWLEERPKSTPEIVETIRAERALMAFDKKAQEHLSTVPLDMYTLESERLARERKPLEKRLADAQKAAKESLIHPERRDKVLSEGNIQKNIDRDMKHLDRVASRIAGLEKSKKEKMAEAVSPQNAARIERWYEDKIKPLKATQSKLANQVEASRAVLERQRSQPKREPSEQTEKHRFVQSGKVMDAVNALVTRKSVRFLVATAIGPGLSATVVAAGLRNMTRDREAVRQIEPSRIADLRKGVDALVSSGDKEAKCLKHWQGKEDRLAARLELDRNNADIGKQYLKPEVRQAAEKAETIGNLINRSEKLATETKLTLPSNLEPMRGQLELLNARCQAMGLPPITKQGLDAFSYNGLSSALNEDPALRKMSQGGSQWVQVPMKLVEAALGKMKLVNPIMFLLR